MATSSKYCPSVKREVLDLALVGFPNEGMPRLEICRLFIYMS